MTAAPTTVELLTPAGTGAIAVLAVRGPDAWRILRTLFQSRHGLLPDQPTVRRWLGTLAGDDVVLIAAGECRFEVHCHGGRAVVDLIQTELLNAGGIPATGPSRNDPWVCLQHAKTTYTAAMLLDQCHGAFHRAVKSILQSLPHDTTEALRQLNQLLNVRNAGRCLTQPWKVAIVGAPNAGKSSLLNALAGYERTLVSPIAGTTRDAVRVMIALNGWPVELIDTAGQRTTDDPLECAGIAAAVAAAENADQVIGVVDGGNPSSWPALQTALAATDAPIILVINKCDEPVVCRVDAPNVIRISAHTGENLSALIQQITAEIHPEPILPGTALPYTDELGSRIHMARSLIETDRCEESVTILTSCLIPTA